MLPSPLAAPVRERAEAWEGEHPRLQEAILATLAYHDLLRIPLTAVEVWRWLIRPRGVELPAPSLWEVQRGLSVLAARGVLDTQWGFFALPGRASAVAARRDRHARAQEKWALLRRIAWWLQAVPFLRMVAGSGSLAREAVREESDLDVLIVATAGRIWTVRFLVTVLLDALKLRRRPAGPTRDLVCLNHYLTLDSLRLPYQSLYTAYETARLVPLVGVDVCRRLRSANRPWMEQFLVHVLPDAAPHRKTVRTSPLLSAVQRAGEWLLRGWVGDVVEQLLASLQTRRIARGRQEDLRGRVVADATRLEFHPRSPEAPLLAAFNARMEELGLPAFGSQEDSGLSPGTSRPDVAGVATDTPTVSVIIPVRSPTPELAECLAHLQHVTPPVEEILVVTDGATGESAEGRTRFLAYAGPPAVKRNAASRVARGDILAFLDDDAYPDPAWLTHALPHFADPSVAAVGGPAVTPPHDRFAAQVSGAVFTSWLASGPTQMRYTPTGGVRLVDDWPSVNLLVRRDVFAAVGGFGTDAWPGEDTKLCLDVIRRGQRILYDPAARVFHHRATTLPRHFRQVARYGLHRGFFAKRYPETSRRFSYVLPLLATVLLAGGIIVVLRAPAARLPLLGVAAGAALVVVLAGVREALRARQWALALAVPPALVATHVVYGLAFLRGLLTPQLKHYQRTAR